MGMDMTTKLRDFHQARWDEPVIFELTTPGERGVLAPEAPADVRRAGEKALAALPADMVRQEAPKLPEMGQMRVLKHYLRLSQENLGADLNIDIGQGTCTMKYSPKINEILSRNSGIADIHPYQDESTVQGALEIVYELDRALRAISGMDAFSLQSGGGSQGLYAIISIIRAWVEHTGQLGRKDEIVTTIFSHPTNAAVAKLMGFRIITIYPGPDGRPDIEAFRAAVSDRTAALMITNPEDTGVYNHRIREFTDLVHAHGGLCSYDQANLNGIIGVTRALESGFDLCFFNLHKTFSAPHGCGGPGSGVVGVRSSLRRFLPVPLVEKDEATGRYYLDYDLPNSVGKIKNFHGNIHAMLKALAWIRALGADGLREVARVAVLNNNYMFRNVLKIRGASAPYAPDEHRMEQVRYSWQTMKRETGVTTSDVQNRMFDFGVHYWTSHEPWVVPEPFTIEPTESYSKQELDEFLAITAEIAREAYETPELVRSAPHRSTIHHIDHSYFDDEKKWAITWRMYRKKFDDYFVAK